MNLVDPSTDPRSRHVVILSNLGIYATVIMLALLINPSFFVDHSVGDLVIPYMLLSNIVTFMSGLIGSENL
jgi:hypothetical protein